jgi:hypothetical protein
VSLDYKSVDYLVACSVSHRQNSCKSSGNSCTFNSTARTTANFQVGAVANKICTHRIPPRLGSSTAETRETSMSNKPPPLVRYRQDVRLPPGPPRRRINYTGVRRAPCPPAVKNGSAEPDALPAGPGSSSARPPDADVFLLSLVSAKQMRMRA